MQSEVINHEANRKRAVLKNTLIFAGQKSEDKVHGDGDSEKCFEKNSNYDGLFLNSYITWCMDQGSLQILSFFLVKVKDTNSTIGTGPCAKWFKGEDCPFYPEVTIRQEFKISCKDAEDSYCECIWFCWNNKDVYEWFDSGLSIEKYDDCTTRLIFL